MTLRQLEAFRALMISRTVTKAAEFLSISQPATTRLISDLETSVGFPLFERRQGRLFPTHEAEELFKEVERSLVGVQEIAYAASQIQKAQKGQFHIAAAPCLASAALPFLLHNFMQTHTDLSVKLTTHASTTIMDMVQNAKCDLGMVILSSEYPSPLGEHLFSLDSKIAIPRNHPLAQKSEIHVTDLQGQTMILGSHDMDTRQAFGLLLVSHGIKVFSSVDTNTSQTMCSFVESGNCLAIVDPITVITYIGNNIVFRNFSPRLMVHFSALYRADKPALRVLKDFVHYVKTNVTMAIAQNGKLL
ncbi:MAG: LysR substrate-binding domain-containing protein [Advenella sp.]